MVLRRTTRSLFLAAATAAGVWLFAKPSFVPSPARTVTPADPAAVAGVAALTAYAAVPPAVAEMAQWQKDKKLWETALLPLSVLVMPGTVMVIFVLYLFDPSFMWERIPGHWKAEEYANKWKSHPLFKNDRDPLAGLVDPQGYKAYLERMWEQRKPEGSKITVTAKMKEWSQQKVTTPRLSGPVDSIADILASETGAPA